MTKDYCQEEEEMEEEALSLCDLPINEEIQTTQKPSQPIESQEDFDFGSLTGNLSTQSQMCAADDIFFQGQILPLIQTGSAGSRLNHSQSISRYTSASSRSSSIKSHHSTSSGSTTTTASRYNPRIRNQFHSHPSPTPRIIRSYSTRHRNSGQHCQNSTLLSFFQMGLVRGPEIHSRKSFCKCNSTSSNGSVSNVHNVTLKSEKKTKQLRLFDRNSALFGGCKNSVEAVPSRIVKFKRSMSVNEANVKKEKEKERKKNMKTKEKEGKAAVSRHRTFEWLKQLSLEDGADEA